MADDAVLLSHAALVGLTPLIPVPLLDDAVKGMIERRMVKELGRAHDLELDAATIAELCEEPDGSLLATVAKGALEFPFKLVFRKVFFVLEVKRAADEASRTYHRGWLLDRALRANALAPKGPRSASEIRIAVRATCEEVGVSPVSVPMRAVFEASKDALERAGRGVIERLSKGRSTVSDAGVADAGVADRDVEAAVENAASDASFIDDLVSRLRTATASVPKEHFDALRSRFEARLGVPLGD